jgi:hypothetical protein
MQIGVENRDGESIVENVLYEAVHNILESDEIDKLFDDCDKKPPQLYHPFISNENPPTCNDLSIIVSPPDTKYVN